MFNFPVKISRPKQGFDGEGSNEGMAEDCGTLWCDPQLQDKSMIIVFGADEDVRRGDLVEMPYNTTFLNS